MNRLEPYHQLSLKDFFLPFDGKLSGESRLINLAESIPWGMNWRATTRQTIARAYRRRHVHYPKTSALIRFIGHLPIGPSVNVIESE
jgi:hypothetical protein